MRALPYPPMVLALCLGLLWAAPFAQAAPYRGDARSFVQPDGQAVEVRLFGSEFHLRAESADGYTLAVDPTSGWICYAEADEAGGLRATGIRYHGSTDRATLRRLTEHGVVPGLRAGNAAVASTVAAARRALPQGGVSPDVATSLDVVAYAKINPTLGSGKGLVVLVDFEDRPGTIATSEYEKAFNGDTYDSFGSIRTWIEAISYGKYTATHTVLGYMRAAYPTSHYLGGAEFDYSASTELMKQVFKYIDDQIDLTDYASNGAMPSLVVIYPGAEIAKVWATGLWPHAGEGGYTTSEGVRIPHAFISNGGTRTPMKLDTFRHELGHSLFNWPDTYDYDDDSAGAGGFATETTLPCAPFRAWSGWLNVIDVVGLNQAYALPANGDTCLRYKNASNASEFFVVEYMRKDSAKRPDAPDEGLLIWHVDEKGDNSAQDMTATKHYVLSVEQADGLFELEKNGSKRAGDLFHAGYKDAFDDTTTPNSRWWNGTSSGFKVCAVGALDPTMSVTVGCSGTITPAVDAGAGGTTSTGGASGAGGRSGVGGTGSGGRTGAGGSRDAGRDGAYRDGPTDARDVADREADAHDSAGTAMSGGASGSGGSPNSGGIGGTATAVGGAGGTVASGGSGPAGGTGGNSGGTGGTVSGQGGTAGRDAGSVSPSNSPQGASNGCSCAVSSGRPPFGLVLLFITLLARRRRTH